VIDTLVAEIQNTPGEDRCIILIGYNEPMREMFQYSNPGLGRRFPLSDAFHFEDFSIEQLTRVLELKLDQQKLTTTEKVKEVALQLLAMARGRLNFGNGGEVDNLISRAIVSYQRRISSDLSFDFSTPMVLQPEDFDADFDRLSDSANRFKEYFKDFVGCEDIISRFEGFQQVVKGMRMNGINPRSYDLIPLNFVFKGPSGTRKTTMARIIGNVFYDIGFLSSSEVVECSVSDMMGDALGQTGPKVISVLERALGKVSFIDEAYRLAEGDFAVDAINELVDCMTKERFINKLVIILVGYETGMESLKNMNQGFASRFGTEIVFHHLSPNNA
jgi:SpoVK/Ycf46/Vps4 family AAA+-type ATPase